MTHPIASTNASDDFEQAFRIWHQTKDLANFLRLSDEDAAGENRLRTDSGQGWLSRGLPHATFSGPKQFEDCIFWFPKGIPRGVSVHFASSRLGKQPDQKAGVFDALRTFATRRNQQPLVLISHPGSTLHDYVNRLADLFDISIINFKPFPAEFDSDWLIQTVNRCNTCACYYQVLTGITAERDHLLIQSATEVQVLSARATGKIADQVTQRLQDLSERQSVTEAQGIKAKTYSLVDSSLTTTKLQHEFHELGAIEWWLFNDDEANRCNDDDLKQSAPEFSNVCSLAEFKEQQATAQFMIHWTRDRTGPWPDQTEHQFLDDIMLGLDSKDHSRVASLCRIVASRRILASAELCRSNVPVVCFADVPVDEVPNRRIYRSHVGRWDFETCGIAIRKSTLQRLGAKPVIYGTDDTWDKLSEKQRPYFQIASSKSSRNPIDWTCEKEHRICGNVTLDQISSRDAFVFVQHQQEANRVAPLSRWPIVILGD